MLKLFQLIARLLIYYCIFIVGMLTWPLSGIIAGIYVYRVIKRRRLPASDALGSARWAEESDLLRAGMIGATTGPILGRLPRTNRNGTQFINRLSDPLIRIPNCLHTLLCGPSGSGKGVSFIVPTLYTDPENTLVLDVKGELANLTARYREKRFGHRCVLIDPYRAVTRSPDTLNICDYIFNNDPLALDDCKVAANALVHRTGQEKDPHFVDSAEFAIAAVLATTIAYGQNGSRSLLTVQEILSHPEKLEMATKVMRESDLWGGALSNMGGQLSHYVDRERSSVLTTALRFLSFLSTPAIAESVSTSTFNPTDLLTKNMTIYLIIPPERAQALSGLLRLCIGSLTRTCMKGGVR